MEWIINILIIVAIFTLVTIANRVKAWSKLALVETAVVGYLSAMLYGIYAIFAPAMLFLTVMNFPKRCEKEKELKYDARIIETNIIIGLTICILASLTNMRKELFMLYNLVYSMHLVINSCVRFKYYFNCNEPTSLLYSYTKGLVFIFLPGIFLGYLVFGEVIKTGLLIVMCSMLLLSGTAVLIQRRNQKEEVVSIENGYTHMAIALVLTIATHIIQYFS